MKKIFLFIFIFAFANLSAQIKVEALPTTTVGTSGDFLIKDRVGGGSGATQKISVGNFISTYSLTTGSIITPSITAGTGISIGGSSPSFTVTNNGVLSIEGVTNRTTVTGTTTPTITISSSYPGQTSITTLGAINTGTWNGTVIDPKYGGTGIGTGYTIGDIIQANGQYSFAKLNSVSAGSYLRSVGTTSLNVWSTLKLPNSATANYIPYATSTNTWGESSNLVFDASNIRFGIGTASPSVDLNIKGAVGNLKPSIYIDNTANSLGTALLRHDNTIGFYIASHVDPSGNSTVNAAAAQWSISALGHFFSTSPATSIGNPRTFTERLRIDATSGNISNTGSAGTAYFHLKAGTSTASTSPLKFTSGVNLSTPEAGAVEYDGTRLYYTTSTPTRITLLGNNLGISGGTTLIGGTASGDDLTIYSTSHATKGNIYFGNSTYDEANNRLGVSITPLAKAHFKNTSGEQDILRCDSRVVDSVLVVHDNDGSSPWLYSKQTSWGLGVLNTSGAIKLYVKGTTTTGGQYTFYSENSAGTPRFAVNNGGYSGFNTDSETSYALKIKGTGNTSSTFNLKTVDSDNNTLTVIDDNGLSGWGGTSTPTSFIDIAGSSTSNSSLRIRSGTAPTVPNSGDIWHDATQKALQNYTNGIVQTTPGVLFTSTADASITSTTVTTSLIGTGVGTLTLPANFFVVGKTIRIKLYAVVTTTTSGTGGTTITSSLGTTTLTSTPTFTMTSSATNAPIEIDLTITCRTTGVSGTVSASGLIKICNSPTSFTISRMMTFTNASDITLDTTTSHQIKIDLKQQIVNPDVWTGKNVIIETLN